MTEPETPGEQPADAAEVQPATGTPPRPTWTYLLMPAAVLLGALAIAGAIWFTRDDGNGTPNGDGGQAAAAESTAGAGESKLPATPAASQDLRAVLFGYAKQLGLDMDRFQQCLAKPESQQLMNTQSQRGVALGVDGTPTFFINNKKLVGALPAAVFDEVIAAELKGSPTSVSQYSETIQKLAATNPPRFQIMDRTVDVSDAQIEGNPEAKVMIAEFSDFQCPFCKRWVDDNLKRIRGELGDDVALAFLHFPIVQIHPNAGNASLIAICAGDQGKFWPMHDLLFARQAEWENLRVN